MSPKGNQCILQLLALNMAKHGNDKMKNEEDEGVRVKRDNESFNGIIIEVAAKKESMVNGTDSWRDRQTEGLKVKRGRQSEGIQ